jgi:tetratricopeptide (TPR) repeat protein
VRPLGFLGVVLAVGWASEALGQEPVPCLAGALDRLPESETVESASARAAADAEGGKLEQAAARARAAILSAPASADVSKATDAYMRAMSGLLAEPPRETVCLLQLASDTERFAHGRCDAASGGTERCKLFANAGSRALLKLADLAFSSKEDTELRRRATMREAGQLYLEAFERMPPACKKEKTPGCPRPDEMLYNAATAFASVRDLSRSMVVREQLLALPAKVASPDLVMKTAFQGGVTLLSIADFSGALSHFERAAIPTSKERESRDALENVVVLRTALGDSDGAIAAAKDYLKRYGASTNTAQIDFAIGEHLGERGKHADAVKWLESAISRNERFAGAQEASVWAHATLATSLGALGRKDKAERAWLSVLARSESLRPPASPDPTAFRVLARTLTARGQAILELGRPHALEAMAMKLKKGDAARLKEKRAKVEQAANKLAPIFEIKPMPPPGPVVEAAALVARMNRQLWGETHLTFGADAAEAFFQQAQAANKRCVELSVKFQHTSPAARKCGDWLAERFPDDHARLGEFVPRLLVAPSTLPRAEPITDRTRAP